MSCDIFPSIYLGHGCDRSSGIYILRRIYIMYIIYIIYIYEVLVAPLVSFENTFGARQPSSSSDPTPSQKVHGSIFQGSVRRGSPCVGYNTNQLSQLAYLIFRLFQRLRVGRKRRVTGNAPRGRQDGGSGTCVCEGGGAYSLAAWHA